MVKTLGHCHFVFQGFFFLDTVLTSSFPDELEGVELAIVVAAAHVDLAEPSNGETVVYLESHSFLGTLARERVEKLSLFYLSLAQAQTIVVVDIAID
jgi:hypothetical protein